MAVSKCLLGAACSVAGGIWLLWRRSQTRVVEVADATAAQQLLSLHDCFIFDCDGVLYTGASAIAGAVSCVNALQAQGKTTLFVTNNSAHSRRALVAKFHRLGFTGITPEMVFSSGYATALYLRQLGFSRTENKASKTVFATGADGLVEELEKADIRVEGGAAYAHERAGMVMARVQEALIENGTDEHIGAVVTGFNEQVNYFTLCRAVLALQRPDTLFIATNDDRLTPQEAGLLPGGGAAMGALAYCSSRQPTVIGKPNQYLLDAILANYPLLNRSRTLMIGDRLDTDVAFGHAGGLHTMLVLSGCSSRADVDATRAGAAPHYIAASVAALAGS